jgi:hypothetical protein
LSFLKVVTALQSLAAFRSEDLEAGLAAYYFQ